MWLEGSPLGHAMRSSGVWTYGVVNLVHILGVSALFGAVLLLDLRLLGVWRSVPLALLARPVLPVAKTAFAVAAISGVCLLSSNGTEYIDNPFLLIKFPAIGAGLLNAVLLERLAAWQARGSRPLAPAEERTLAVAGGVSLASWLTAIAAGRMIGYW